MPPVKRNAKPRRRPGKNRSELSSTHKREQEITDFAVEVFHSKGYAAASVDDVANAVGILKGSLYYYIDTKEDLLMRIVEQVHEEVEALLLDAIGDDSILALERLSDYITRQIEYNARNLDRVRVYYHDFDQLQGDNLARMKKLRRRDERRVQDLISEAKKAGELPAKLDERLATKTLFASVLWMYTWFRPGGDISAKRYGTFCANFVLNGLRGA